MTGPRTKLSEVTDPFLLQKKADIRLAGALCSHLNGNAWEMFFPAAQQRRPKSFRNAQQTALYAARYLCVACPAVGVCAEYVVSAARNGSLTKNDATIYAGHIASEWVKRVSAEPEYRPDAEALRAEMVEAIDEVETRLDRRGAPYYSYAKDVPLEIRKLRGYHREEVSPAPAQL